MRTHIFGVLITWSMVGFLPAIAAGLQPGSPADRAFRFFADLRIISAEAALESLRPIPISPEEKRRELSSLPRVGQLQPTPDEAAKLGSIQRVLIYHKRQDVFEAKVIDLPQAGVVLHARSILLISRPALRELSATELQAAVAHEAGHEYFWADFEHLREGDATARQELELRCDAIAVLTLLDLGLDPGELVSAVRTVTRFNERIGATLAEGDYPSEAARAQFIRRVADAHRRTGSRNKTERASDHVPAR